jgi:post-segregation antitoxin (ccd killing protein)
MPRPKKPPRVRVQIVFERGQAKQLREFCKARDLEISHVVRYAVGQHLTNIEAAEWQERNGLDA